MRNPLYDKNNHRKAGIVILKNKKEFLFIAGVPAVALLLWVCMNFFPKNPCTSIRITVDGKEYGTYSLKQNQIIPINDTNICEIKNGRAFMTEANCPDHLCMEQNYITEKGGSIIGLPNKIIREGETASSPSQVDATT